MFQRVLILGLCIFSSMAQASLNDGWKLREIEVKVSTARKADGTIVTYDPKDEVALKLELSTQRHYGTPAERIVHSHEVIPAGNDSGKIQIHVEEYGEFICADRRRGTSVQLMGPHYAQREILVKPGHYALIINGILLGGLNVQENSARLAENPLYPAQVRAAYAAEFNRIFGDVDQKKFESVACSFETNYEGQFLNLSYFFPGANLPQSNGDVLIRAPRRGSANLRMHMLDPRCNQRLRQLEGWSAQFSSVEGSGLNLQRRKLQEPIVDLHFRLNQNQICHQKLNL